MSTPLPRGIFSRRSVTASLSVRASTEGVSSVMPPNVAVAKPATPTEGAMLTSLIRMPLGLMARTKRSHIPAEALSATTNQPSRSAMERISESMTVFPNPRWPVMSIRRPGAPAPSASPDSNPSSTSCLPISTGGTLPAVGLKGLGVLAISITHQCVNCTLHYLIPTYTVFYQCHIAGIAPAELLTVSASRGAVPSWWTRYGGFQSPSG